MNYWIFKCNPARYDIDRRLLNPEPKTSWTVTRYRHEMMPGDIAFIWRTGPQGGIVASMRLDSPPQEIPEIAPDKSYWAEARETGTAWRVVGAFTHRLPCLDRERIRTTPGLEGLSVFRGFQQATNFRVSRQEGEILTKLIQSETDI